MGTRHLIEIIDTYGIKKLALYGQWDGYRSGQGLNILNFLQSEKLSLLKASLWKTVFVTDLAPLYEECNINVSNGFIAYEDAKIFGEKYPGLSRDTSANILDILIEAKSHIKTSDASDFAEDTLFCEGHYIIDFHKNIFVVSDNKGKDVYYLDNLPSQVDFLKN